jgi:hypothetical protein
LTINRLPDELLLEIFDSYRQSIDPFDDQWRKKFAWLNLAHVCRRWRAVMFASSSRLDLIITVGPRKPGHIKTILSSPLPISIEYTCWYGDITGSALWRMRAAIRHRDRVREISFGGQVVSFGKFIRATNCHFPALESLSLSFPYDREPDIPATFLRGPDQSNLPLRRLRLDGASLASVSGLLISATALTDLTLDVTSVTSNAADFESSQGSFLLTCLQGMECLRSLDLTTPDYLRESQSQHSTPNDVVPLLKLTRFHYFGPTAFLNNLMSGLSAPSLQDVHFILCNLLPILHLPRFIDGLREQYHTANVTFYRNGHDFRLSLLTHSGDIDHVKPSFRFHTNYFPGSIKPITGSSMSSTKLATTEELALLFPATTMVGRVGPLLTVLQHDFPLREFLRQFRSVKVLRLNPFVPEVALSLRQDDGEALLPLLEEIVLSAPPISRSTKGPDEEYQDRSAAELAAFEPFVSAREQMGRHVKISHREMPLSD